MRTSAALLLPALALLLAACTPKVPENFVRVDGGSFKGTKTSYTGKPVTLPSFYLGKYEVTQQEWAAVMGDNPSRFKGDTLPVENVSWYDCIEYCNRRSLREGLAPYYTIDKNTPDPANRNVIDTIKWTVTTNPGANGYRLPTQAEWEYAASGGQRSRNFTFAGSDEIGPVAWFWQNAGDKDLANASWSWPAIQKNNTRTHPVGGKAPNELGLFDLSGNVREWCWDWAGELDANGASPAGCGPETGRAWKGGGWIGGDFCCAISFCSGFEASGKGPDQGLRLCRNL